MPSLTQTPAWIALQNHQKIIGDVHLRELFEHDAQRFTDFSRETCGLFVDFSKNRLSRDTLKYLFDFADQMQLGEWIAKMYRGELINHTEQRAALHIALRNRSNTAILVNGENVMPKVNAVLAQMRTFSEQVRDGRWLGHTGKPIDTIVNIGIGGSDLGPAMVCQALRRYHHPRLQAHFISNVDGTALANLLPDLNPETTLFIVASKTFSTQETMLNAHSARRWLIEQLGDEQAVAKHFVALSTHAEKVEAFGIHLDNMFEFWDWVGGRYSLWSAIGLSIVLMLGMDEFENLLAGAHAMDQHFHHTPWTDNVPVILGLIGVWYSNFLHAHDHVILPYDWALERLPAYLQQLVMESLGKHVDRAGNPVDYATCPTTWGAAGNNGQHSFYQLLHQGTHLLPADFIVAVQPQQDLGHQNACLSNALAQTHVLMMGRTAEETAATGMEAHLVAHRTFVGNQPTNTILYQRLTPTILGSLIALYEHKTFVQSVCWDINPFDQWGVELGKQVANELLPELENGALHSKHDASTNGLLAKIQAWR